ncbi:hypothetical protein OHA21_44255 [Actinoplanes sp. NBC_00393]|uniref:hypothetical protein n=1 Tax=Actinoplanes sp. NBC_00393 TaxID=2975953 RepID=UPI002E2159AB
MIETLDLAARMQPQAGVTRTVVVAIDASAPDIIDALTGSTPAISADDVMPLRRVSDTGLRSWLSDNDLSRCFDNAASQSKLMQVTGGWLSLLDRAAALAVDLGRSKRVCDQLEATLSVASGAGS